MPNKKYRGFRQRKRQIAASPTNEVYKSKRKQWQMLAAIDDVKKGATRNQAADTNSVPRSTLKDRLSGKVIHGTNPGPLPYLTVDEETLLMEYLLKSSKVGYGKTRRDLLQVESYLKQKGSLRGTCYSNGWWEKFLRRNPSLRLRAATQRLVFGLMQ